MSVSPRYGDRLASPSPELCWLCPPTGRADGGQDGAGVGDAREGTEQGEAFGVGQPHAVSDSLSLSGPMVGWMW